MQRWFESRLDPFPDAPPAQPPATLYAFCRHYTRGAERWLLLLTISTGLIALAEVALYAYVGALVDRMNAVGPGAFMAQEGPRLAWMAALVLVVLPSLVLLNSLVQHQTLLGNFPMRIRWNVHRYLLRQSMGYFQDEFAGRIATKLMQTSLAVRETVVKLLDIGNYVLVYFGGTLIVAASADWRLMLPFVGWLGCYALLMRWFVPRMGKVSQQQADARSDMTGRIVDSWREDRPGRPLGRRQEHAGEPAAALLRRRAGGRILIDGQDIARVTQDSLRAQIGMVTQDTSLLHRSVRDNILYGRPDAGDDEMRAAAGAPRRTTSSRPGRPKGRTGYDAHVGERGVKLSGGQRQRIAIARVMLKDAPILLLDEATSALDSEVEAAIQASLYRLMEGKTVIAIAHRLSTIAAMDRLVVMDKGRIVERPITSTTATATASSTGTRARRR
jgi:ABC-type multidrug transport system fused ATPase/permease subunit